MQSSWSGTQYSLPPQPGEPALGIKAWIANAAAKDLARRGGRELDTLRAAASKRGFKAVTLNVRAAATLLQRSSRKTSANVIGVVKGTNPSEAVIYSAHWDHFGTRDPQPGDKPDTDRIFNGAYDNASGCAGVLEIAKAFAKAPQKPARSIYIAFVTGEESGLLGSAFLAANPPVPIEKVAANINIDEVNNLGPTTDMVQLGVERSTLGPMIEAVAPGVPNARWIAIRLLDGDGRVERALRTGELTALVERQQRPDDRFSRKIALQGAQ